jgi:ABC-type multidrug transport system fused ATPase/permease subunit
MLDDIGLALRDGLSLVATFVPKLLLFLVVLLIGWLIAKALRKLTNTVLERVGFDRAVERGGVGRALARSRYDASDLVATLIYYAVLLITLQIAFAVFGPNPVSDLLTRIVALLPQIAVAIVVVVVAAAVAAAVKDLVSSAMGGLSYGRLLANAASAFIIGLGLIAALSQVGIALAVTLPVLITVLAVVGGILVVGVGGGLVAPMRQRWEHILNRVEQEGPRAAAEVQAASRAPRQPNGDATSSVTTTPIGVGALASDPAVANGNSGASSSRHSDGGDR